MAVLKNDGRALIVAMDHARTHGVIEGLEDPGKVIDTVIEAGAVRFRPILLTALAIILGSAIMITDPVFGGLAVSLIFGTFASTALTLVVIPLMYYLWQRNLKSV